MNFATVAAEFKRMGERIFSQCYDVTFSSSGQYFPKMEKNAGIVMLISVLVRHSTATSVARINEKEVGGLWLR
jgi:hypothetical protein